MHNFSKKIQRKTINVTSRVPEVNEKDKCRDALNVPVYIFFLDRLSHVMVECMNACARKDYHVTLEV